MNKKTKRMRNTMIITLVAATVSIAAGGGVFAWFAGTRTAEVKVMSLTVGTDTTKGELKYCSLNKVRDNHVGYKSNDTRIVSDNYDAYFFETDINSRKALEYAPGYSFTFAIEVTGGSDSNKLVLSQYTAEASETKYHKVDETDVYFSLAEAFDVYTAVYDHKPTSTELVTYFNSQGMVGDDRFTLTDSTTSAGTRVGLNITDTFNGENAYVLMTLHFSNDENTWYSLAKTSTVDEITYDGSALTYDLEHTMKQFESLSVVDTVRSDGRKGVSLSGIPYEVTSLKINGQDKTSEISTRVTYSGKEKTIYLDPAASDGDEVEVTYTTYSSMYSLSESTFTFESTPLAGAVVNLGYKYEEDYYEADPVKGDSNVFENLSILLNEITVS